MPDDARAAVGLDGVDGRGDGFGDGEVLVGFGDAHREAVVALVVCGEASLELEEAFGVEDAVEQDVERGGLGVVGRVDDGAVVVDVPGGEVVQGCEGSAVAGGDAVGGDDDGGESEDERELADVRLELGVGARDVGAGGAGLLELDDGDGEAVEVEHDVEAAFVLAGDDGDLVDDEPVVLVDLADEADGGRALLALVVDVGEPAVAVGEEGVCAVALGECVLRGGCEDLGERLVEVVARDVGVEGAQGGAQA